MCSSDRKFVYLLIGFSSIFSLFFYPTPLSAQTKRIYIANDDHTDYMWTANESIYKSAMIEMLDYYLNQADTTAGNAVDFQGRFNADGNFWMWLYEKNKTATDFQKLINRIKDGHITVPLNTLAMIFGGQSMEAVIRGMYYPGRIERKYNLRFPITLAMENQTLPYGVGSLWTSAGAQYSWRGICNCATQLTGAGDREKDIYWWTGLDGSRILLKWNSLLVSNQGMGGYAEARDPLGIVDYVDTNSGFKSRYSYNVIGAFGKGWDDLKTLTNEFISAAQSKTTSIRAVRVSNETDFFQDFETNYGSSLTSQAVSFGNEWDLFSASVQEFSSRIKRAVEKLRSAEAMATLVSLANSSFMNTYTPTRDQAFIDLSLFWEHCGGSGGSVGEANRSAWMKRMVVSFEGYVNTLYSDSLTALTGMIQKTGTNTRFMVFNPLSWVRDDIADVAYSGTTPINIIEVASGQEVPSQIITKNSTQYIRILASQVPSVGYKIYEIRPGAGTTFPQTVSASNGVIESDRYKVTVANRGAITSLVDKQRSNREFAKSVNSKYINDLGSTTNGTLTVENSGPVSATILATSSSPVSHTSRITLYTGINRIDIENNITQSFSGNQLWGYSFNLTSPEVNHEEVGAVIRARLSSDSSKPGQYSPRANNTRYDWLTLNHFADMTGAEGGVTLSNADVDFMRLGNSSLSSLDTTTSQISPVAGGQLGSGEDYSAGQGGASSFFQRFSLQTHDTYSQTNAMKFALEHQNPFVTGIISNGNSYPASSYSLLTVSDPNVLLWAVKPAEEGIGQGIITRFWNQGSSAVNTTVTFPGLSVTGAKKTTSIETDISDLTRTTQAVTLPVNQKQVVTMRTMASAGTMPSASPSPSFSPGDINRDGVVNFTDLKLVISNYLLATQCQTYNCDVNGDGKVSIFDAAWVIRYIGV